MMMKNKTILLHYKEHEEKKISGAVVLRVF